MRKAKGMKFICVLFIQHGSEFVARLWVKNEKKIK